MPRLIRQVIKLALIIGLVMWLSDQFPRVREIVLAPIRLAQGLAVSLEVQQIQSAVVREIQAAGHVPGWSQEQFRGFVRSRFDSRGRDPALDSWGQPYHYFRSQDHHAFLLISLGPDGAGGTRDDIEIQWRLQR